MSPATEAHAMRLTLTALLLLLSVTMARASEPGFDVTYYEVAIKPDFKTQTITGTERIRFTSTEAGLSTLAFSANSLAVYASLDGDAMVRTELTGDQRLFHLPAPLRKGQAATLVITLTGKTPKGLVFDGETVSASYFTCDFMICDQDRTADCAQLSFELTLETGMDAVAPGQFAGVLPAAGGQHVWHWRARQPRPAYLFGFAAGRLQRVILAGDSPMLDVLTASVPAQQVQLMFAGTRHMLAFFERKAGVKFPDASYTQVLINGSEAQEAVSHAVIGLDEITPILADPHEDWVIAHELAHQWWGNAITCADWSELWLNEGLTVFMVAAYKEERWGRADYDRELALANRRWQAAKDQGFDVPLSWQGKYPSLKLKRAMAYAKSVVFLDRLRTELGERTFWRSVRRYTRQNYNHSVTATNLQASFERESGRSLAALFDEWVYSAKH